MLKDFIACTEPQYIGPMDCEEPCGIYNACNVVTSVDRPVIFSHPDESSE